jgi:two-component system response regulator HydG
MPHNASILVVDDESAMRKTLSLILTAKGYTVTTARDGAEAIARVKEQPFDVIFLDIVMPLMDGVAVLKQIKTVRPEATVIMMTAYAVEELVRQALAGGANGILHKPLDMDEIIALVEKARATEQGAFILVVDDDPGIAVTLQHVLAAQGYEVGIAHSGEEAITLAREKAFDLLFVDIKLPAMNGLETFLTIKEFQPQVAAIFMTGYRQEVAELVSEALDHAAYTCLYKPFDMEIVLKLVEEIVARKQQAQ